MARLYEYQGKALLREHGVRTPRSEVVTTPDDAAWVAAGLGGDVVVKAQVWATGRFKAGGIRFAASPGEAADAAQELLYATIKGCFVERVLVEERLDIARELYAAIIVDDAQDVRGPVLLLSATGGVDIEQAARETQDSVRRLVIDIRRGLRLYDAFNAALDLGLNGPEMAEVGRAVHGLWRAWKGYDCRSAEINPLVLTRDGHAFAADCRISIDDASVMRHPELGITFPREADRPPTELERIGWQIEEGDYRGVAFFAQTDQAGVNGCIGYHAISGGGALLVADALTRHGLRLANIAETSGNPTASKVYRCARVILAQPGLDGYCLIGAVIANQDQTHHAHGLVKALREKLADRPGFPVVVLLAGNNEEDALRIVREGLGDLPIRLECYGREHIHRLDEVAGRLRALVEEYRAAQGGAA